ncbi:nuclear transport factor 2 family protein [Ekhidna sp.]|uniref:nuclear transport factor 2 family protein n=1 Tax=Ekhidna sp. TaxID=2608089 RepID=UPI003517BAE2
MKNNLTLFLLALSFGLHSQSPQETVDALYASINYDGKTIPDFKKSQGLFTEKAQFKWVNDSTVNSFTPSEFLKIYEDQIKEGIILKASEYEISNESEVYGNIAHFFSSYKAEVQTSQGIHEKRGINSIQLIKNENNEWKIAAMVWYDEDEANPLPLMLDDKYSTDRQKIEKAALNYVESIYKVDTTLLKSVSPDLVKRGYYYSRKNNIWSLSPMTYKELKHTAATYNQKGWIPASAPQKVEILDMDERVANVKVYAIWGFDYLLMTKNDQGDWMIDQILWQSYNQSDQARMVSKMKNK